MSAREEPDREEGGKLLLDFGPDGMSLIPVVTQDHLSKEVLILSWINAQAFRETLASGYAVYWSRSRNCLWPKGESSGNRLKVMEIRINCEQNSLLLLVEQEGTGACHTKDSQGKWRHGCYYRRLDSQGTLVFVDTPPYSAK